MHDFGPGEDFRGVWVNGGSKLGKRGMKGGKSKISLEDTMPPIITHDCYFAGCSVGSVMLSNMCWLKCSSVSAIVLLF